ncbi:hypothetical protein CVS40_5825 [Lucilia cuprina]|nr:hypothetical protein CVS40_5825 [Lucilia cuprina]
MNQNLFFYSLFVLLVLVTVEQLSFVAAGFGTSVNLTKFHSQRQKRGLIFTNGGTLKLSIGPSMPVRLADPIAFRSLVCSYNLQGGHYKIPPEPTYPWDKWEDTFARSLNQMRRRFENYGEYDQDESREFLYMVLEKYMSRNNVDGRQCLLRAICENAQVHEHIGVFANVLDVVLTPGKENLDNSYRMALQAGRHGADCIKLFNSCPKGSSLLDQYIDEL